MAVALYLGFSFSVNNCFDHEGDRLGVKASRNPIALDRISVRSGLVFSATMAASGLAITVLLLGVVPACIYFAMLTLSAAYSAPVPRLKSVPFVDMLSHGLFFGSLIVVFGLSVSGGLSPPTLLICAGIFLASLIVELNNQIEDVVADAGVGLRTTAVTIGPSMANRLFSLLLALHICVMVYLLSQLGSLVATTLSLAFFLTISYKLFTGVDRRSYFFVIEKITPLVYFIFLFHLIL